MYSRSRFTSAVSWRDKPRAGDCRARSKPRNSLRPRARGRCTTQNLIGGPRRDVFAVEQDAADEACTRPETVRNKVVLPAPFEPTMQVISPAADRGG